jgi:hypothetical protein
MLVPEEVVMKRERSMDETDTKHNPKGFREPKKLRRSFEAPRVQRCQELPRVTMGFAGTFDP